MAQTNLQIPMETKTRDAAQKVATRQGFSSLNVALSKRAESRYKKLLVEKSTRKPSASVEGLLAELES